MKAVSSQVKRKKLFLHTNEFPFSKETKHLLIHKKVVENTISASPVSKLCSNFMNFSLQVFHEKEFNFSNTTTCYWMLLISILIHFEFDANKIAEITKQKNKNEN